MDLFPVPSNRFWAKLSPKLSPTTWHPLIAHSADVAAVLDRLLQPDSMLSRRLAATVGLPALRSSDRARLVFLAGLHDMGKTNHGFQSKARPDRQRGSWNRRGHVKVLLESMSVPALRETVTREILPRVDADPQAAAILFATAICHHGRSWMPATEAGLTALWQPDGSGRDPMAEVRRLIRYATSWSHLDEVASEPFLRVTPAFTHFYAGALTLADWIGSTTSAFNFAPDSDNDPERYWDTARQRADLACTRIGVVPRTVAVAMDGLPLLERLFPRIFADGESLPTDLQRYVATMPLPGPGSRILIESETGSGKTEAALALYARLRAAGLVGGLMFALPTRATASAMFDRVCHALTGLYPEGELPTVALAVGGRQPHANSAEPWVGENPQTWPDEEARNAWSLANWASSHNKKFLAAEIVVGTLDQVLLGGLPVRHAHLRLAALSRHLLVVDELHSFDRYMTGILARLLELHAGAGGVAVFMSATLSSAARVRLGGGSEPDRSTAESLPYPTLSVCDRPGDAWRDTRLASGSRSKLVRWRAVTAEIALAEAVSAAAMGARVCVLRNTVRAARETTTTFREQGHGHWLWHPTGSPNAPAYHSRYTVPDRLALDRAVLARFGKEAAAMPGGVILIATQVVEQSLDVDFDLLVTDLCPVDVLLQRIGREHRHPQRDPHRPDPYRSAQVLVVRPDSEFAESLNSRNLRLGWGEDRPYPNYADGELTLRLLAARPEIEIPRDNRVLVEAVYHLEARDSLKDEPGWDEYLMATEGRELGQATHGRESALDFDQTYTGCANQFNMAQEHKVRTRLGDDTIRIELPGNVRCWYSDPELPVNSVDLPVWTLPRDEESEFNVEAFHQDESGITSLHLGDRQYRYTPDGWEW